MPRKTKVRMKKTGKATCSKRRAPTSSVVFGIVDFEPVKHPHCSSFARTIGSETFRDRVDRGYFSGKQDVRYYLRPITSGDSPTEATHALIHYCPKHDLYFNARIRFYAGAELLMGAAQSDLWRLWMLLSGASLEWVELVAKSLNEKGVAETAFYSLPAENLAEAQCRGGLGVVYEGEIIPSKEVVTWH
ncbi:hypothetical protein [Erwinia psidii]|uniref:Uncharacterized protein n=1 Tax=Erwinia psidii TaxID=69224 RepID=A0A3N6UMI0_9GAMM|nr:hypothetical protein [Erwinia psidii]MCX8958146.1 hypothetical protein [Erwinia psidii]RQM37129.1 hypothetical protein EB241_17165 [Erwinia psidii]